MSKPTVPVADPTEKPDYIDILDAIRDANPGIGNGEARKLAGPAFQRAKETWNIKQGEAYKNDPLYREALRKEARRLGKKRSDPDVRKSAKEAYENLIETQ